VLYRAYSGIYGGSPDRKVELAFDDVSRLLAELGLDNADVQTWLFRGMDEGGAGKVSFKDVCYFSKLLVSSSPSEKAKFLCQACDAQARGSCTKDEIQRMMMNLLLTCHRTMPGFLLARTDAEAASTPCMVAQARSQVFAEELFSYYAKDEYESVSQKDFLLWIARGGPTAKEFIEVLPCFDVLVQQVTSP